MILFFSFMREFENMSRVKEQQTEKEKEKKQKQKQKQNKKPLTHSAKISVSTK